MYDNNRRALVVDDESAIRHLTIRALTREGFDCDAAADGLEASQLATRNAYDVIVTDLRMPNRHGHSLAVELLALEKRPLIIVLTGVIEPRLAKDLIARGIDDIVYKPVSYGTFAAKVKALLNRRNEISNGSAGNSQMEHLSMLKSSVETDHADDGGSISIFDLESKLSLVSRVLPISEAAIEVFEMARSGEHNAAQLAAAVEREPSLATEVLRLANSSFYNPSAQPLARVEEAVPRIGQKRVGELALAASTIASLTTKSLPWMDIASAWRASVAAGIATDYLLAEADRGDIGDGLFLSAIMHDLGRIVLGTLYPNLYDRMTRECRMDRSPLIAREKSSFPEDHGKIMARLLKTWNIPDEIADPLTRVLDSYESLSRLPEPKRGKVEVLKLAVLIGKIAARGWEPWHLVELPPNRLLSKHRVHNLGSLIEVVRHDLNLIINFKADGPLAQTPAAPLDNESRPSLVVNYCNLSDQSFDFVKAMLPAMDLNLNMISHDKIGRVEKMLVNCIHATEATIRRSLESIKRSDLYLIASPDNAEVLRRFGRTVLVPNSHSAILLHCRSAASERDAATNTATLATGKRLDLVW